MRFFSSLFCYALFRSRKLCGTFFVFSIDFCLQDSDTGSDAVSTIGNTASLSSTAAESLERAMRNYLKSGSTQQADTLLNQYKSRMTPAQKARFEALFAEWQHPVSW